MAEFPTFLASIVFQKASTRALWFLFIANCFARVWGLWRYCTPWNCGAGTGWGPHSFWQLLSGHVLLSPITATLAAAVLLQISLVLRNRARIQIPGEINP